MSLGSKYLARKRKSESQSVQSEISLGNTADGILPLLYTTNILKPKDTVEAIDFHWQDIKDGICPITIYVRKEASRTSND